MTSGLPAGVSSLVKLVFAIIVLSPPVPLSAFVPLSYEQKNVITLNIVDRPVAVVLDEIEKQTDFRFYYNSKLVDTSREVTVKVKDADIFVVLDRIFRSSNIGYKVVGKDIILTEKEAAASPPQQTAAVVTGIVTDGGGKPVAGAGVSVRGTAAGTAADANGRYSIAVPGGNAALVFTFPGYVTLETTVGGRAVVDAVMAEDYRQIDEVVVVGYGTQRRINLTGAVDAVDSEVFEGRTFSNSTQALQGVIPNLNISLADGKQHRTAAFNVRGLTSIGQGGSALVLIDGVEGDPSLLNPNDIESVSVLKDAASASIYGSRGAFGVVLITTKTPQKGKTMVNYTGNFSVVSRARRPEYVTDGVTYLEHFRDAWVNQNQSDPNTINLFQNYSDAWLGRMREWKASGEGPKTEILSGGDYEYYTNTDHYAILYKDFTFAQDHNLSVSGGSEKGGFYLSGRFYDYDGMYNYNPDVFNAQNLRGKGSLRAYKWLRIFDNMEYSRDFFHQPLFGSSSGYISPERCIQVTGFPTVPVYNPDDTFTRSAAFGIGGLIGGNNYRDNRRNLFKNTVGFNTDFLDGALRVNGDFTFRYDVNERFEKSVKIPFYDNANQTAPGTFGSDGILERTGKVMYTASNLYTEYENTFARAHRVKGMVGWNYETYTYSMSGLSRSGLLLESAESILLATGGSIVPYAEFMRWKTAGIFFRANYSYRDRYLVEVNGRYDGSSRFPTSQQWGFFPSISAAWRVSEEPFWKVDPRIFSDIKVRVSYGSLGNGNIAPYNYLEMLYISTSTRVLDGAANKRTAAPAPIPEGLTWERATTTNFGLDFGMLRGRLRFDGDYYIRKTTDMYTKGPTLPAIYGAQSPKGNFADLTTRGFEITLTWQDRFMLGGKPFNYQVRASLYDYYSTIDRYNNPTKHLDDYYEGRRIGEIWGFETDGLFRSDPDPGEYINTILTPSADARWRAGDVKIRNRDNSPDNMITMGDSTADNPGDLTIIGNSAPRYQYSFSLNADWNGIFVSAFFTGVGKQDWFPGIESAFWGQYNRAYNQIPAWHLGNYWTETNTDAYLPRYRGGQNTPVYVANDRYLQNVSYLMLKNIQVGYVFSGRPWMARIGLRSLRIHVGGENLASWSPFYKRAKKFMDVPTMTWSIDPDGWDGYNQGAGNGYPLLKNVTLGVSVTF